MKKLFSLFFMSLLIFSLAAVAAPPPPDFGKDAGGGGGQGGGQVEYNPEVDHTGAEAGAGSGANGTTYPCVDGQYGIGCLKPSSGGQCSVTTATGAVIKGSWAGSPCEKIYGTTPIKP